MFLHGNEVPAGRYFNELPAENPMIILQDFLHTSFICAGSGNKRAQFGEYLSSSLDYGHFGRPKACGFGNQAAEENIQIGLVCELSSTCVRCAD